jgi:opacity protein-like surface antigen
MGNEDKMRHITRLALAASALTMISVSVAAAADIGSAVIEPEPVPEPPVLAGGWYLRGDISYDFKTKASVFLSTTSSSSTFFDADFDDTWNIGAGIGYVFNDWFRADLTGDYRFPADWDAAASSVSVSTILLNGYATLGSFSGISPYVGAGIGAAFVNWDTIDFPGFGLGPAAVDDDWRFAYALMAGVSFDVTENLAIDTGYRFTSVDDGQLIGPGFIVFPGVASYSDLHIHEFRIGMRYTFGNFNGGS